MKLLEHYWWIGLLTSTIYTIASVLWSLRVERKLRVLAAELRIQRIIHERTAADLAQAERHLSQFPTLRMQRVEQ